MSGKFLSQIIMFTALLLLGKLTIAQAMQDVNHLELAASHWLEQKLNEKEGRYQFQISNLDSRLRLTACQSPLAIEVHGNKELRGRISLKVSCLDQDWFVYLGVEIAHYLQVVVARTDLPRRANLSSGMLQLAEVDVAKVRGNYYTQLTAMQGLQLRNRVREGEVITSSNIVETDAVNRGEQISIIATNGILSVRMAGEALNNGKIGDQIRVKNLQSGRVIRALVVGRGRVEVRY